MERSAQVEMNSSPDQPQFTAECRPPEGLDDLVTQFNEDGYVVIKNAISLDAVERLRAAGDRIVEEGAPVGRWWGKPETAPRRVEYRGFFSLDDAFMELLAPPAVLPFAIRVLGSNLHMTSSNLVYQRPNQPPVPGGRGGWHRDLVGSVSDLGYDSMPRMALRAGYYLTDVSDPGSGITLFSPGSHKLREELPIPEGSEHPANCVRPEVEPGDALIWENRTFHAPERNESDNLRKALMVQYGFRWLGPVDYIEHPPELLERCDPAIRQLLDSTDINKDGSMTRMKGSRALTEWAQEHGLI